MTGRTQEDTTTVSISIKCLYVECRGASDREDAVVVAVVAVVADDETARWNNIKKTVATKKKTLTIVSSTESGSTKFTTAKLRSGANVVKLFTTVSYGFS